MFKSTTMNNMKEITYTCPMHPEVQEKKPGQCPKCGMTLVPVEMEMKHEGMDYGSHTAQSHEDHSKHVMKPITEYGDGTRRTSRS
jgi:predicted ATP-dependent serine protease